MRNPDLQAHFEKIQKRDSEARKKNIDSGLTCALENLAQFLEEDDVDAAIAYLEDEVGIKALNAHLHTFPPRLKEKAGLLRNIYIDLDAGYACDSLDTSALIENYLQAEGEDNGADPAP